MKTPLRIRSLTTVLVGALSAVSAIAATYHVKPGGNDLADGLSDANAWATIAKVNATTLVAGDQVLFKAGGVYNDATLVPSGSGTSTNRIIYSAYGAGAKPTLTTAIVLPSSGWTTVGGGVYSRPLATETRMVTVNNTYMVRALTQAALLDGEYFWDVATGTLYVKDPAGSPNTTGKIYEAAQRDHVVHSNPTKTAKKPYQTFSGLRLEKSNLGLAVLGTYASYYTFEDCEFFFASSNGQYASAGVLSNLCDGLRVVDSRFSWLEGDGIYAQSGANVEIIGNEIDHLFDKGGDNGPDGIQVNGLKSPANNFIVKDNIVRRETNTTAKGCIIVQRGTGGLVSGNRVFKGAFGIAVYTKDTVVEYNYVEDSGNGSALRMWENEGQTNVTLRYNIVNGSINSGLNVGNATYAATPMANIRIYNNLFYNTYWGVGVSVPVSGEFRNNIIWSDAHASPQRRFTVGSIIAGQTFVSDNNIIQDKGTNVMASWLGTTYNDLATYQAGSGQEANSLTASPAWVSPGSGDFHLQAGSPAINAGAALGATTDFDGNPVPNGGATDIGPLEYGGLIAYEGFDYTAGSLTSANGGLGWSGSWTVGGSAGITEILTCSHAWTALPATGNRFRIYDTDGAHQEISRTLTKTFGAISETYWLSFLVKKYSSGREAYLDMNGFVFKATSGDWQVKTPSTSYTGITSSNYAGLHLIVARVDAMASGDIVYVWVDPVIALGEPSVGSAAATRSDPGFTFNTVKIKHGPWGNSSQSSEWDELRFGTSFGAVVSGP
ncbi:right-handed parallel beta-helix repeat-containing protein [Rariglobus hedericola]|uniref:Right-handed parallel beta-helix repeat-containing protein n=1 Tax=Rariglobus hedericola TaxID=2597822 RepID=A0A556QKH8_9BACT|nr:right-handed parallel beta-helix repeat-containing protein [Rariglobus hedericola]TSJ77139.1 right-handed parallel beta-helix repeat-containing protein [Rariglobus hedericola]